LRILMIGLASTGVAKPEVHAEDADYLVKPLCNLKVIANDDTYALAA